MGEAANKKSPNRPKQIIKLLGRRGDLSFMKVDFYKWKGKNYFFVIVEA